MTQAPSSAKQFGGPLPIPEDARLKAFCSAAEPDLFHSVAHHHQIWKADAYDVETIHAQARDDFQALLQRASSAAGPPAGRILLLQGESGSGKTHLMRAFRSYVHGGRLGYFGYLQMTSATSNYARYVLNNLIDSLDHPYWEPDGETSGLMRLSNALAETPHAVLPGEVQALRDADLGYQELAKLVFEMADNILAEDRFGGFDINLVRVLLYLQRGDARLKKRVLAYIRCEDLADYDRQVLGGIVPRKNDEDPQGMIVQLGKLMQILQGAVPVVCIDQLEEMHEVKGDGERFRRAMSTVCALADRVPSSLWVIACLDDFYTALRGHLTRPLVDRIERDPEPISLTSVRSAEEVHELVQRRLRHLYETEDVPFVEAEPAYPFPAATLDGLARLRTRDVLAWCGAQRDKCILAGTWVPLPDEPPRAAPVAPSAASLVVLEQAWNDFLAAHRGAPPDDEAELATLLAQAIGACSQELLTGHSFRTTVQGRIIHVEVHGPGRSVVPLVVGVCNREARGGGLGRQIKEVEECAGQHTPVIVRSTDFSKTPRSEVNKQIGQLVARGGRRTVVEDSDWRTMQAFAEFQRLHAQETGFAGWLREGRPLSRLKSLRVVLDLDSLRAGPAGPAPAVNAAPTDSLPVPSLPDATPLALGRTEGRQPQPVTLDPQVLTCHAAFLGGSGSGKTTAALNVVEQLLLRGVPALLLDRKGDLCGYARPDFWTRPAATEELAQRRDRLHACVDVAVFTPGNPAGRPLSMALLPDGIQHLPDWQRQDLAGYAAFALGGMMGYKDRGQDASRLAILKQAMMLLTSGTDNGRLTLEDLMTFIGEPDPALLAAIGQLDNKLCRKLAGDLETLRINKAKLLTTEGQALDTEHLLGLGKHSRPGKTRLSVVSTKFLGDNAHIEFWVAQLLMELARWASKNPTPKLQAVLLFDEADLYLPAQRKPATKEPMENLLKRARSAGVGVLLASQSPGDFDYRCRDNIHTWFLGRITQQTSLNKMKPLLSDCRTDVAAKLPGQQAGQFQLVRDNTVTGLRVERSLLVTEQMSEEEILQAARAGVGSR